MFCIQLNFHTILRLKLRVFWDVALCWGARHQLLAHWCSVTSQKTLISSKTSVRISSMAWCYCCQGNWTKSHVTSAVVTLPSLLLSLDVKWVTNTSRETFAYFKTHCEIYLYLSKWFTVDHQRGIVGEEIYIWFFFVCSTLEAQLLLQPHLVSHSQQSQLWKLFLRPQRLPRTEHCFIYENQSSREIV